MQHSDEGTAVARPEDLPQPGDSAAVVDLLPGVRLAGRFLINKRLGSGATGTVFSALDITVGQKVAVKLLRLDLGSEISRERLRRMLEPNASDRPSATAVAAALEKGAFARLPSRTTLRRAAAAVVVIAVAAAVALGAWRRWIAPQLDPTTDLRFTARQFVDETAVEITDTSAPVFLAVEADWRLPDQEVNLFAPGRQFASSTPQGIRVHYSAWPRINLPVFRSAWQEVLVQKQSMTE